MNNSRNSNSSRRKLCMDRTGLLPWIATVPISPSETRERKLLPTTDVIKSAAGRSSTVFGGQSCSGEQENVSR